MLAAVPDRIAAKFLRMRHKIAIFPITITARVTKRGD